MDSSFLQQQTMTAATSNPSKLSPNIFLVPQLQSLHLSPPLFTPPPCSSPPTQSTRSASSTNPSSPLPYSASGVVTLHFSSADLENRRIEQAKKAALTRQVEKELLKTLHGLDENDPRRKKLSGLRLSWRAGLNRRGGPMPGAEDELGWVRRLKGKRG
ncbi:hypothetical protein MMC10_003970 [Thelotrema lepadinum]|nr:hypothetical protein [Thelotrema lepadinum]